ncbi:hypothetical protein PR001_g11495 [Phytophthora rubi]|uniref:Tyr recombinase domain-containing protein n=1 Tax=Phytophthora rubi TaxID=129364 RepID=A0A6A3MNC7_9STRA|nr:hypothetical protein PR001_g11495 [Phytophthora rubi]
MGYFFLLRRSEYLADKGRAKPNILRYTDVVCLTKDGNQAQVEEKASSVRVKFRGSKTDQSGHGETRIRERSGLWWACPVRASWLLLTHQRQKNIPSDEPLCSVTPGKIITATDMTRAVKQAAQAAGEEPDRYGTHSMRSGGATALFTAGIDRLAIKRFGRWKSDAYERYTRIDGQVLSGLAANLISSNHLRP